MACAGLLETHWVTESLPFPSPRDLESVSSSFTSSHSRSWATVTFLVLVHPSLLNATIDVYTASRNLCWILSKSSHQHPASVPRTAFFLFILYLVSADIKKEAQPKSGEVCFVWWIFLGLQAQETASHVKAEKTVRREAKI